MNVLRQIVESPQADALGWCLVHAVWQVALLGAGLKLALAAADRHAARLRYHLGLAALAGSLLFPVITGYWMVSTAPSNVVSGMPRTSTATAAGNPPKTVISQDRDVTPRGPVADTASHGVATGRDQALVRGAGLPANRSARSRSWTSWIACAWVIGVTVFSIRLVPGFTTILHLRMTGRQPVAGWIEDAVQRLARQMGVRRRVAISGSRWIDVPAQLGVIRPLLLLPVSGLTSLSAGELEALLLHELAHVKRHDFAANLFQVVVETLLFFHPAVWWISATIRMERENCCDDMAVAHCGQPNHLARALARLEQQRITRPTGVAMSAGGGSLVRRIRRLTRPRSAAVSLSAGLPASLALLTATLSLLTLLSVNTRTANPSRFEPDDGALTQLEVVSLNDLYAWDSRTTTDLRLVYKFWNMFPLDQREQPGEVIEGWTPDLEFRFSHEPVDDEPPRITIVRAGLRDGFRWSVGRGIWLLDGQWPLRYGLNELITRSPDDTQDTNEAPPPNNRDFGDVLLREKLVNDLAVAREQAALDKVASGHWVAVVDGNLLGSWESFESCVAAADQANRHAMHRFIYRPGIDDQDIESFASSPWASDNPGWWQFGRQFQADQGLTIAPTQWIRGARSVAAPAGKASFVMGSPAADAATSVRRRAVCSGLLAQQLTITGDDAQQLNLYRFAIPGTVFSQTYQADCMKVHTRVTIDGLDIQQRVVAFVIPQSVVNRGTGANGSDPDTPLGKLKIDLEDADVDRETHDQTEDGRSHAGAASESVPHNDKLGIEVADEGQTVILDGTPDDVERVKPEIEAIARAGGQTLQLGGRDPPHRTSHGDEGSVRNPWRTRDGLQIPNPIDIHSAGVSANERGLKPEDHSSSPRIDPDTWTVTGEITDDDGVPLAGVRVWAATGAGSLRTTGETRTDSDGTYSLTFGPGIHFLQANDVSQSQVGVQAACIFAALDGYAEVNLCREGDRLMAESLTDGSLPTGTTAWGSLDAIRDRLILKGQPVTINFVMQPSARIRGFLVDQYGHLLQGRSLSMTGSELPPGSSVLDQVILNREARFEFQDVPPDKTWQFSFRLPETQIEVVTPGFHLDPASEHVWLVTADSQADPPTLTYEAITDEQFDALAGRDLDKPWPVMRGRPLTSREQHAIDWGPEQGGLRAAMATPDELSISSGSEVDLELWLHNVSDEPIRIESENWRQDDELELKNADEVPVLVGKSWYTGWPVMKTWVIDPGEVVVIDSGNLQVRTIGGRPGPSGNMPVYRADSLKPGRYSARFRVRIPGDDTESDTWRGELTSGTLELEIR